MVWVAKSLSILLYICPSFRHPRRIFASKNASLDLFWIIINEAILFLSVQAVLFILNFPAREPPTLWTQKSLVFFVCVCVNNATIPIFSLKIIEDWSWTPGEGTMGGETLNLHIIQINHFREETKNSCRSDWTKEWGCVERMEWG